MLCGNYKTKHVAVLVCINICCAWRKLIVCTFITAELWRGVDLMFVTLCIQKEKWTL